MIWYLVGINILAFIIYGIDKRNAIKNVYRVSEYSLLMLAVFGGGLGGVIGMKVFHHKTRKLLFWIVNIVCLIIWIILVI